MHEVDDGAVEAVGDRRARRTAGLVFRPEHEVVDEQLRPPAKQVVERRLPVIGVELVLLVNAPPRELAAHLRELVTATRVLLLGGEQLAPCGEPVLARALAAHTRVERTASS